MRKPSDGKVNRHFSYPSKVADLLHQRINEILHSSLHYSLIPASVFKSTSRGGATHVSTLETDPLKVNDPFLEAARKALQELSKKHEFTFEEFGDTIPVDPQQPMS